MLEIFGRTDVPVGVGIPPGDHRGHQSEWIGGYGLYKYPGRKFGGVCVEWAAADSNCRLPPCETAYPILAEKPRNPFA
jgi:hypothetical protein